MPERDPLLDPMLGHPWRKLDQSLADEYRILDLPGREKQTALPAQGVDTPPVIKIRALQQRAKRSRHDVVASLSMSVLGFDKALTPASDRFVVDVVASLQNRGRPLTGEGLTDAKRRDEAAQRRRQRAARCLTQAMVQGLEGVRLPRRIVPTIASR